MNPVEFAAMKTTQKSTGTWGEPVEPDRGTAGADVRASQDRALGIAVYHKDVPTARALLLGGASARAEDDMLLGSAIVGGSLELVRLLLAHGADPNCKQRSRFRFNLKRTPVRTIRELEASGATLYEGRHNPLLLARNNADMLCSLLLGKASAETAFRAPNRRDLSERAWCISEKFDLCKALLRIADPDQQQDRLWVASRPVWLASFAKALNSWRLATGDGSKAYNSLLMEIHFNFHELALPDFDHVIPLGVTMRRLTN